MQAGKKMSKREYMQNWTQLRQPELKHRESNCTLTQVFYPVRSIEQMRKCVYMAHTHTASSFLIAFASNSSSLYRCASLLASLVLRVTLSIQFSDLMREHGCMSEIRATWIKRIFHNSAHIYTLHCCHFVYYCYLFRLRLRFRFFSSLPSSVQFFSAVVLM